MGFEWDSDKAARSADTDPADDLRPDYDAALLGNPVRGKYAARMTAGVSTHIDGVRTVSLPADLDAAFPTDQALCDALREWLHARQDTPAA